MESFFPITAVYIKKRGLFYHKVKLAVLCLFQSSERGPDSCMMFSFASKCAKSTREAENCSLSGVGGARAQ
jgi:hypothetical protein